MVCGVGDCDVVRENEDGVHAPHSENAMATRVAGVSAFVLGGGVIFLMGGVGASLAALGLIGLAWEQAALMILGGAVAAVGLAIPRRRQNVDP
jgi:hypothetical protein